MRRAHAIAADLVCVGTDGVAAALRVRLARAQKLLRTGAIPSFRLTPRSDYRVRLSDLQAYLDQRARAPQRNVTRGGRRAGDYY